MDNLKAHAISSLCEAFPAREAFSLAQRLEIHCTPKHGGWLNIAEIELSALSMQCLNRRIPDMPTLPAEVDAWQAERNLNNSAANWQFSTGDARIKL